MSVHTPHSIAAGFLQQYSTAGLKAATQQLAAYILEYRLHAQIEDILLSVQGQYQQQYGVVEAVATSVHPLTAEIKKQLQNLVVQKTSAKTVVLHEEQDESVLGGVKVATSAMEFDFTLRSKLDRLRV